MGDAATMLSALTAVKLHLSTTHDPSPYADYLSLGLTQIEAIIRDYEHALQLFERRKMNMDGDPARKLYIDTRFEPIRRHIRITAEALRAILQGGYEYGGEGGISGNGDGNGGQIAGTLEVGRASALKDKIDEQLWRVRKCQAPLVEVVRALGAMTRPKLAL